MSKKKQRKKRSKATGNPQESQLLLSVIDLLKQTYSWLDDSLIKRELSVGKLTDGHSLSNDVQTRIRQGQVKIAQLRVDIGIYFPEEGLICFEVHGQQHDQEIRFSNEQECLASDLARRKFLDTLKADCLYEAGIPLITFWYDDIPNLTPQKVRQMRSKALAQIAEVQTRYVEPTKVKYNWSKMEESADKKQARLIKAREVRRQAYLKRKEWAKQQTSR